MELTKEYSVLFNGITDTISELEEMLVRLKELQQKAEDAYLSEACSIQLPELKKSV